MEQIFADSLFAGVLRCAQLRPSMSQRAGQEEALVANQSENRTGKQCHDNPEKTISDEQMNACVLHFSKYLLMGLFVFICSDLILYQVSVSSL